MANDSSAPVVLLRQPKKKPKTPAERARTYRRRKREKALEPPVPESARAGARIHPRTTAARWCGCGGVARSCCVRALRHGEK
jgi:hypothetical protein